MSQIGSWTGEGPRIPRRDTRHFSTWASAYRLRCGHRHQTTTHRRQEYHWPTLLHQAINSLQLCLVASAAEYGGGGEDLEQSNGLNRLHHAAYDTTETTMSMGPRRCPYRDRPCLDWTPVVLDAYPLRAVRALGPRITCITLHDTETTGPLHPTLCDLSRHGRPSYCLNIRVIIDCINGHLDEAPLTTIPDAPWASSLSLGRQEPYPRRLGSLGSHCFFRLPAFQSITPRIHQCSDGAWVAICRIRQSSIVIPYLRSRCTSPPTNVIYFEAPLTGVGVRIPWFAWIQALRGCVLRMALAPGRYSYQPSTAGYVKNKLHQVWRCWRSEKLIAEFAQPRVTDGTELRHRIQSSPWYSLAICGRMIFRCALSPSITWMVPIFRYSTTMARYLSHLALRFCHFF